MWHWTSQPETDLAELGGTDFTDQSVAEQWLAASWAELADAGVRTVSLWEEDRLVYGPMPLSEE